MNAAIWSLVTGFDGLYVVADVPLVSPEKNASAIWLKNGLDITSVNGSVVVAPPQVPVSARSRLEMKVSPMTNDASKAIRIDSLRLVFMDESPFGLAGWIGHLAKLMNRRALLVSSSRL
jgi:hypothetical protein